MIMVKALIGLGGVGLVMGLILAFAYQRLKVKVDPKEEKIRDLLPGANCGACGYVNCDTYAHAVATGAAEPNLCIPGGSEVTTKIGETLGLELEAKVRMISCLHCVGSFEVAPERYEYSGPMDCRSAYILLGGYKACTYGCLRMGHCVKACPFDAIHLGDEGLPVIDPERCTGCGICVKECPKGVLSLIPYEQKVYVACSSHDRGKKVKDVCKRGCIGCGICAKVCPFNAIEMVDNLPVYDYERCISCGICVHKCPTKAIVDRVEVRPYAIISTKCDGCGECVKVCQFNAIEGEEGMRHRVLRDKCIGCGMCFRVCPIGAITMAGALGWKGFDKG
ncbi:MAG TPA: RnfABCDGE type electron transport complex subunit B [bacterium (Candidatus Stahlbacteria)]|nr:RnfABCDGE type electron transport complex subunit B [Candidatus Stahlbacteria bacterium]